MADLVRRDAEALALAETLETGKPITQSRNEVAGTAELWEYAASLARNTQGDAHNALGRDTLAMVVHEPIGVVGMITPWNFPLLIISQKLPFALAAGNTAVIKPSESTSATTVMLGQLIREAGFPAGVVNIVTGDRVVGGGHRGSPRHRHDQLHRLHRCRQGHRRRGGPGPEEGRTRTRREEPADHHPQRRLHAPRSTPASSAAYFNVGQCCNSGSRLIVHRSIADEFAAAVVERAKHMRVGDPLEGRHPRRLPRQRHPTRRRRTLRAEGRDRRGATCSPAATGSIPA